MSDPHIEPDLPLKVPVEEFRGLDFSIARFGKVISARINVSPLTILVGKNNTGKSYIATMIWSFAFVGRMLKQPSAHSGRPIWFDDFIARLEAENAGPQELLINEERIVELHRFIISIMQKDGPAFFRDIFAYDGFGDAKVRLNHFAYPEPLLISAEIEAVEARRKRRLLRVELRTLDGTFFHRFQTQASGSGAFPFNTILSRILTRLMYGSRASWNSLYIPAARTGLMLSFRTIVSQLFDQIASESDEAGRVQLPMNVSQFLQELVYDWSEGDEPAGQVADWLEGRVLGGRLTVSDDQVPNVTYRPNDTEIDLPIYAASSMVTELAPMLISLRRAYNLRQVFLEEPEAHLHLSAQRVMAQAIARLINAGISVVITTHSDTLIQQINNLIKLHRTGVEKNSYYETEDIINPSSVSGYEFVSTEGVTRLIPLDLIEEGLVVPSLNDTLLKMARETIDLNMRVGGTHD